MPSKAKEEPSDELVAAAKNSPAKSSKAKD